MSDAPKHLSSRKETWEYIKSRPDELETTIVVGIACGSTLRQIARNFAIPYPWLVEYVNGDPSLLKKYEIALQTRKDYMTDFLFDQFKILSEADLRKVFAADGSLLPVNEWPEDVSQFIQSVEVDELYEGTGKDRMQVGWTKKVKLWDKLKALEQLARHLNFSVDKNGDTGKLTWETIIMMAVQRERGVIDANAARESHPAADHGAEKPREDSRLPVRLPESDDSPLD